MHRYFHSGLQVSSTIELPEWEAFASEGDSAPDVHIAISEECGSHLPADGSTWVCEDQAGFRIEGVGAWMVHGGRHMAICPSPAADPAQMRMFTLGSAWALLGYQRDHAFWHGSAVEVGGRTLLFCGGSGEGKSTMAAAMIDAGAVLVADDLSRVEPGPDKALIHPSSSRIKLWGEAVEHFGWHDRILCRDWMREDKFHCDVPRSRRGGTAVELASIIRLETGDRVALERLSGAETLKAVLAGTTYRPEAIEALDKWGQQGVLTAAIVARTPVMRLQRPRDLDALPECVGAITRMLEELG